MVSKDNIIRMAHEAGAYEPTNEDDWAFELVDLERFAALVATAAKAEEREGIAKFFDNKEEIPFLGRHIAWKIRSGEA